MTSNGFHVPTQFAPQALGEQGHRLAVINVARAEVAVRQVTPVIDDHVPLDVAAANPQERRLLIGEAKWGRGTLGRKVLTDLVERSRRRPQVTEGWSTEHAVYGRGSRAAWHGRRLPGPRRASSHYLTLANGVR